MKRNVKDNDSGMKDSKKTKLQKDGDNNDSKNETSDLSVPGVEVIEKCYHAKFPSDFQLFWDFCRTLNPLSPAHALKPSLGLILVGPYDILRKPSLKENDSISWRLHYRYFHDPPEFITVIIKADDKSLGHWGYFRDYPDDMPSFVAYNEANKGGLFSIEGENLFAAVHRFASSDSNKESAKSVISKLEEWANKHSLSLDVVTPKIKERNKKKVVTKTLNNLGLVVHVDENDVGYRPLPESPSSIKKILSKIVSAPNEDERIQAYEPLDEMITLVQFANDECDYGEGVELGLNLLSCQNGKVFNTQITQLLGLGYELLNRKEFSQIIKEHMKNRVMGGRVSQAWGKF